MASSPLKPDQIFRNFSKEMTPQPSGLEPRLHTLDGIRAVLFDVYGTLFQSAVGDISLVRKDSSKEREALVRESLEAAGFFVQDEVTPIAELFLDTIRAEQDIRREQGIAFPEVDIVGVWEDLVGQLEAYEVIRGKTTRKKLEILAMHYEARVNPVYPMPGVLDAIESALDQGCVLGIVSNAQKFTPVLFETFFEDNLRDLGFEEILCIWSYEHHVAKPSTKLYEICAERLQALDGIAAEETLFIGNDMRNDVWPAQQVGFKTGLFAGDKRSLRLREDDPDVKGVKADVVLTHLEQISECFPQ